MILKIYVIGLIAIIGTWILQFILFDLEKGIKNERFTSFVKVYFVIFSIGLTVLFFLYNIYAAICLPSTLKYGPIAFIAMCILGALLCLVSYILEKNHIEILQWFPIITAVFTAVAIVVYLLFLIFLWDEDVAMPGTIEKTYRNVTIEIIEMEQVPYTNTSGSRYYIRSAPSFAYYYKIRTKNGNRTTKVLDGSKYYIEEDVDNQYQDNPHIEVCDTIEKYQTVFGEEKERLAKREYVICVPENGIYYEGE